jgi:hypothetical protein
MNDVKKYLPIILGTIGGLVISGLVMQALELLFPKASSYASSERTFFSGRVSWESSGISPTSLVGLTLWLETGWLINRSFRWKSKDPLFTNQEKQLCLALPVVCLVYLGFLEVIARTVGFGFVFNWSEILFLAGTAFLIKKLIYDVEANQ